MAAAPPEGAVVPGVQNWVTVNVTAPPGLKEAANQIRDVLSVQVGLLNVALTALEVTRALLPGNLNAITALVDSIIEEIEGTLEDFRDIGLYVTGDWNLLGGDFQDVRGGYQAFERRMVGRLTNRDDESRPNFSRSSSAIAIYFYVSADLSDVEALISFMQRIMKFMGRELPLQVYTPPVGLTVQYGLEGATVSQLGPIFSERARGGIPKQANLRWQMAAPSPQTDVAFPRKPPPGFLVEVSVLKDGLRLGWDARKANAGQTDNRASGVVLDPLTGSPFRLYGGSDILDVGDLTSPTFTPAEDGNSDTETRVYAFSDRLDRVPIPLDKLKDGEGRHLLQRTFFVSVPTLSEVGPGQGFHGVLRAQDMPYQADFSLDSDGNVVVEVGEQATEVYVRISAVTQELADRISVENRPGNTGPLAAPLGHFTLSREVVTAQASTLGQVFVGTGTTDADKTVPSTPLEVTFPSDTTQRYIQTIAVALAVLALSRSDLPVTDTFTLGHAGKPTGLEAFGPDLVPDLISDFEAQGVSPLVFRETLRSNCIRMANRIYRATGSLGDVEQTAIDQGAVLLEWEVPGISPGVVEGQTLWDLLMSTSDDRGLALNPLSYGVAPYQANTMYLTPGVAYVSRLPGFLLMRGSDENRPWVQGQGSADMSPVFYARSTRVAPDHIEFCRNVFPDEVYDAAVAVLNISSGALLQPPGDAEWITVRPFQEGVPAVEFALDEALQWVRSLQTGAQTAVAFLDAYIDAAEGRVLELQALIARIDGLLAMIETLELPVANVLVTTGRGNMGLLSSLVNAGNKPQDDADTYGAGIVVVAGGLPAVLVDILQALLQEES